MEKNKLFAIGIPTLNRYDLLEPALKSYCRSFNTEIFVVDNGKQDLTFQHEKIDYFPMLHNTGVAASWNFLCDHIFKRGYQNAIILNDDIFWGATHTEVEAFLTRYSQKHFITTPLDWCNFILPKSTYVRIGRFDEQFFPAYFEDNDYDYRLKLEGLELYKHSFLLPVIHKVSQTSELDDSILMEYEANKSRYIAKWGGEPLRELFLEPK